MAMPLIPMSFRRLVAHEAAERLQALSHFCEWRIIVFEKISDTVERIVELYHCIFHAIEGLLHVKQNVADVDALFLMQQFETGCLKRGLRALTRAHAH